MINRIALQVGREAGTVMVLDRHLETARAPSHRLSDAAHAQDAQGLASNFDANELGRRPQVPLTIAQIAARFVRLPGGAEHQQHADLRRRRGHRAGRVQHRQPAPPGGVEIDMIGADRQGEDRLNAVGQRADGFLVERFGNADKQRVHAVGRGDNLVRRHDVVIFIEDDIVVALQARFDFGQVAARH